MTDHRTCIACGRQYDGLEEQRSPVVDLPPEIETLIAFIRHRMSQDTGTRTSLAAVIEEFGVEE